MLLTEMEAGLAWEAAAARDSRMAHREDGRECQSQPLALTRSFFESIDPYLEHAGRSGKSL